MKKLISIFITSIFLCSLALPSFAKKISEKTMMEIRDVQTRYYDTTDTLKVMKAVVNTLQDNGFIVQNGEMELGYLRARKDFKAKRTDKGRVVLYSIEYAYYGACAGLSFGLTAPYLIIPTMHMKNELSLHPVIIDSNVNIEKIGDRTKVRFIMIEKILENADGYTMIKSSPRKVVRHYNSEIYQEFFNQVDKNLFLEKNL
jgi:hypothetical protein